MTIFCCDFKCRKKLVIFATFLRNFITGRYLENHNYEFSLIDLKGVELEF